MIRSYRKVDLARLYQLDQVCFSPPIAYSRAELQYFLTHPACSCWVAEPTPGSLAEEPTPAGFLILERRHNAGRLAGHIITLDVDPAWRRQGLAGELMRAAEQQMLKEGAEHLHLEVAENNAAAQQFYRKMGFVAKGKIAGYYEGKIDAAVLEKLL